jgi:folate-binding Fe-S cluster repair protein YgfZ
MQDMRGKLKRRLAVLRIDAPVLPLPGEPVHASDSTDPVGEVRSSALAEGCVLAFARLKAPYFDHEPEEREGADDAPNGPLSVGGRPAVIVAFRAP